MLGRRKQPNKELCYIEVSFQGKKKKQHPNQISIDLQCKCIQDPQGSSGCSQTPNKVSPPSLPQAPGQRPQPSTAAHHPSTAGLGELSISSAPVLGGTNSQPVGWCSADGTRGRAGMLQLDPSPAGSGSEEMQFRLPGSRQTPAAITLSRWQRGAGWGKPAPATTDVPTRASSPSVPLPVRGTGTSITLYIHPAWRSQEAGRAVSPPSRCCGRCQLCPEQRSRQPTGRAAHRSPLRSFSSFTSSPLFAHVREVTSTTSTRPSHFKPMLVNSNCSTQSLFNPLHFCIYL